MLRGGTSLLMLRFDCRLPAINSFGLIELRNSFISFPSDLNYLTNIERRGMENLVSKVQ